MRRLTPIAAFPLVVLLAACGSSDPGSTASGSDGPVPVTVAVIPIVDVAPIYLGEQQGFFEEHGIDLTLEQQSGGAAAVPGVVAGDFQFAFGNVSSVVLAGAQDLPLRMVAEGASSTGDPSTDFGGVVVAADSPITSPADLAGKTVAINNLKNINEITVRAMVEKAGGDPASVKFVELGFPDMPAAIAGGKVDAAQVVEPFLTATTSQGDRLLGDNYTDAVDDLTVAAYFTSEQYLAENADVVDDFRAAIEESLQYAQEHPDEVRAIVPTYTKITAEVAQQIKLPAWPQEINVDSVQAVAELMQKYGITSEAVDVEELLATS
ncbi:ABC transporter substrate-binding protein [Kineococcus glutinatus]|uniref:MetQ/NlpA family ABC transporter substrate-binding protein n=1 Tax=Kineococcus glutinatus TaxID=1070872 RepID=A0ABP9HNJ6_9ACTN